MEESGAAVDISDCFGAQRRILKSVGFSLEEERFVYRTLRKTNVILLTVAPYITMIPLFQKFSSLHLMGQICCSYVGLRVPLLHKNRNKINQILHALQDEIVFASTQLRNRSGKNDIKKCIVNGRRQAHAMVAVVALFSVVSMVRVFLEEWLLPFGHFPSLPLDYYGYEIAFVYQCLIIMSGTTATFLSDVLYSTILDHLCVHCRILQRNIRHITEACSETAAATEGTFQGAPTVAERVPRRLFDSALADIVRRHHRVISLATQIKGILSMPMLLQFIIFPVLLCVSTYQLLTVLRATYSYYTFLGSVRK